MSDPAPDTLQPTLLASVTRVRVLLDALGDALVSWRLTRVQTLEGDLTEAVAALQFDPFPSLDPFTKRRLVGELANVANALTRCRQLGASISDLARLEAHAMGETEGYNAVGEKTASGATPLLRARA